MPTTKKSKTYLTIIYQRCVLWCGICTILLGMLIQQKTVLPNINDWWFDYAIITIGAIVTIGCIAQDFNSLPKTIQAIKRKIQAKSLTLAEHIAQEERQDALSDKTPDKV